ncbi:Mur ligase domain-containing protein, partial [Streptomyces europaeiscabiei]|uniref:Mur ligase domain-containing protein n=1 Tax=Streptomyces europaeiscabiei TaxID=146819 RepID=UPI001F21A859
MTMITPDPGNHASQPRSHKPSPTRLPPPPVPDRAPGGLLFSSGGGAPGTLTAVPHADQSQTTQKDVPVTYPGPPRPIQVSATPLAELAGQVGAEQSGIAAQVTGITHDSRAVRPGDVYAALPGARLHGADFVDQAVGLGA